MVFRGCRLYSIECGAFVTDGTPAGTRSLEPQSGGELTSGARDFFAWNGRVYFQARSDDPPYHRLISTDGTPAGTRIDEGLSGPSVTLLATTADRLFYSSGEPDSGEVSLYSVDRGGLTTELVSGSGGYQLIGVLNERIVFQHRFYTASGTFLHFRLSISNGEAGGTVILKDLGISRENSGIAHQGLLYFALNDTQIAGLWRTDGTLAGTGELVLGLTAPRGGQPRPFRVGAAVVADADANPHHKYLWRIEPETLATRLVDSQILQVVAAGRDRILLAEDESFRPGLFGYDGAVLERLPLQLPYPTFDGPQIFAHGDRFYLTDALPERKLWETDATAAGTRAVADFPAPPVPCPDECGNASQIAASGDLVFFYAEADDAGAGPRLSVWDRARNERRVLLEPISLYPSPLALPGGRAVFLQHELPSLRQTLWRSDGTAAGTRPFFDLPAGYELARMAAAGERLFLVLHSPAEARQSLWISDLTAAGTLRLVSAGRFSQLIAAGGNVFFAADAGAGQELGFSDGTAAGTVFLDLRPGFSGSLPAELFVLDDQRLLFAASADAAGYEPWISDGTADGTFRLTDLNPGEAASAPSHFAQVGGRLFFQATDGTTGRELWALDLPVLHPCPEEKLCLRGGRFEVSVEAEGGGRTFAGRRVLAGEESGVFSFFTSGNWEMLVKVLDGCNLSGHFWVYASAATDVPYRLSVHDRWSGETRTYSSSGAARPILDAGAFATCGAVPVPSGLPRPDPPPPAASRCPDDPSALCLGPGGLYRVKLDFRTAFDSGRAAPVPWGSQEAGLFTFFSAGNWEALVKVLDGCAINGKIWVFAAGTTDVGWTLEVEDRTSGIQKIYENPLGQPSRTVTDTGAFDCGEALR